jgi:hypothetical protein
VTEAPPTREVCGLSREVAARLRVKAERARRIAEIVADYASRGQEVGVLGDGTAEAPFLIL